MVDREKVLLLKDWDDIRERVKKVLKRLGHDIVLVPEYDGKVEKKKKQKGD